MCSSEPSGVGRGASLIAAGTRLLTSVGSARSRPQPDLIAPRPRVARGKLRDSVDAHVAQSATFAQGGTRLLLRRERGGSLAGAARRPRVETQARLQGEECRRSGGILGVGKARTKLRRVAYHRAVPGGAP